VSFGGSATGDGAGAISDADGADDTGSVPVVGVVHPSSAAWVMINPAAARDDIRIA